MIRNAAAHPKTTMPNILLIDDDHDLLDILAKYFRNEGFTVDLAHDGESGVSMATSGKHDIAILDVMMPGIDGITALKSIRVRSDIPVIMLTAKGENADRVEGLEGGADDYVPKPCMPRELMARIRAILRRAGMLSSEDEPLRFGRLAMWPSKRRVEWHDSALHLTSSEFSLLELLARNIGRPVSKSLLSQHGLNRTYTRHDRAVDMHMSAIRRKIDQIDQGGTAIQTVFRQGYLLVRE
ncbi:MAG: response regulator transcription factor [Rhodocyclaceae bacterium]